MARDFLAIPATSVLSEQVFSLAGQILTKHRSSLSEGMMNSLMCTKNWLGFQELSKEDLEVWMVISLFHVRSWRKLIKTFLVSMYAVRESSYIGLDVWLFQFTGSYLKQVA